MIFDPTLRDAVAPFLTGTSPALTDQESSQRQTNREQWQREIVQNFLTNLHDDALSRTAWAVGLDEELVRARKQLADFEAKVLERTAWARAQDEELANARKQLADLEARAAERTAWARTLDEELASARARIAELEGRVLERTQWAQSLEKELAGKCELITIWKSGPPSGLPGPRRRMPKPNELAPRSPIYARNSKNGPPGPWN